MIRAGSLAVHMFRDPLRPLASYTAAENAAKAERRGVWSICGGNFHPPAVTLPMRTALAMLFVTAAFAALTASLSACRGMEATKTVTATTSTTATPNASQPSGCALQLHCWSFETGKYSQYEQHEWSEGPWADQSTYTIHNVGHSECDILTSPVHEGSYASRCQVRPTTGTSTSDRAEMVTSNADATGDASQTQFYGWWTMFPSVNGGPQDWWHQGGDWNDFFQFGQYPNGLSGATWPYCGVDATSSPARLYCEGPGIPYCSACGRHKVSLGSLVYDHWYHFVVEARWSSDPSIGYLSIWVDGVNVSPKTHGATLTGTATQVHVSWGMYRGAYSSTNTVIHDSLCRAATYQGAAGC
jgi:hypothetical protein